MDFGQRIQLVAKHYNMSISELAEKSGLKRTTIQSYIFRGDGKQPASASLDSIVEIIKAFENINIRWLLTGEGSMLSNEQSQLIDLPLEKNIDFKEKYYEATEKIMRLQEELISSNKELIGCLKSKISAAMEAVH